MRVWGEVCRRKDWRGWVHHGGCMYGWVTGCGEEGGGRECVLWKYVGIGKDGLLESCACVHEGSMCV